MGIYFRNLTFIVIVLSIISCKKDNIVESTQSDYFPIHVGAIIKYKYTSSASSIVYTFHDEGEAVWNISSVKDVDGSFIYSATETKTLMSSTNGATPIRREVKLSFEIIEDKSALITLKGLLNISFNRYKNDDKLNGSKIIIPEGGYVDFENKLGITKIFRIGNRWSETYELVR